MAKPFKPARRVLLPTPFNEMTKHSKNRTAAPVFSYAERNETQYGSRKMRLGRDSLRNFDACSLCLMRARDPRMCDEGHIFCQECVITSLLTQKKEIKRQEKLLERMREEEEQERQAARQLARERVLRDFEKLQSGAGTSALAAASSISDNAVDPVAIESIGERGTKRKFALDEQEVTRLQEEHEEKAMRDIEREQAEKRKAKLPNFWLPSLTPNAAPTKISEVKLQTLCRANDPPHPISLKSLTTVKFHTAPELANGEAGQKSTADPEYTCPSCRKTLSNNVASFVLKPCGHVLCGTCVETLVKKASPQQCAHCDTILLPEKKQPIVAIKREGTGYAGGGMAEAKKFGVSFQA